MCFARSEAALVLRSAWLIQESSRLLAEDTELSKLSAVVRQRVGKAAESAVTNLEQKPTDIAAIGTALYGVLYVLLQGLTGATLHTDLAGPFADEKVQLLHGRPLPFHIRRTRRLRKAR